MKRTNLMLDEQLLKTATQLLGVKTYSATVNKALEEAVKLAKIRQIGDFIGKSIWEGDLSEMREDAPKSRKKRK